VSLSKLKQRDLFAIWIKPNFGSVMGLNYDGGYEWDKGNTTT